MKYLFILLGLVCLSFMLLPACTPEPVQEAEPVTEEAPSTEADANAVRAQIEEWIAAWNPSDLTKVISLYAEDSVRIPPNEAAAEGKEAILPAFQQFADNYTVEPEINIVDLRVSGDQAYVRSSYRITMTAKEGGDSTQDSGDWITVHQRQADGAWKVICDIWNSDNPPPEGPTT